MKQSEAALIVAKLLAAFPSSKANEATVRVYVDALAPFPSAECLLAAVDSLIRTARFLPTVSEVASEYRSYAPTFAPRALPEPELTPEERRENARRMRELADSIGRKVEP